MYIEDYIISN